MRIFISVASPDRPKAEEISLALRGDGHVVFLDDHDLPVGDTYHERIRSAIEQADIVIFMISPISIQPKRYTLSELKFVQKKWPHPKGHLIPVLAAPTDMRAIPPYLKAVSICIPKGDLAAEVAYEVCLLEKRITRPWRALSPLKFQSATPTGGSRSQLSDEAAPARLAATVPLFLVLGAVAGMVNVMVGGGWSSDIPTMGSDLVRGLVFAILVVFALVYFNLASLKTLAVGILATLVAFVAASMIPGDDMTVLAIRGAVRAGILVLGLYLVIPEFQRGPSWLITTLAGVAGELVLRGPYVVGLWEILVAGALCYTLASLPAPDRIQEGHANKASGRSSSR